MKIHYITAPNGYINVSDDHITARHDYITTPSDHISARNGYITGRDDHISVRSDYISVSDDYISARDDSNLSPLFCITRIDSGIAAAFASRRAGGGALLRAVVGDALGERVAVYAEH